MTKTKQTKVGIIIKEAREKKGYSQNALANEVGIPCSTLCRIESGQIKNVSAQILRVLARPLMLSYENLMISAGYVDEVDHFIFDERIEQTFLLPEDAVIELNSYIKYLKYKYSVDT